MVVVHSPSGIFDVESATLLRELTTRMWQVPEVIRVDSLANFQWVHAKGDEIEVEPLLPDQGPLTPQLLSERRAIALAHETIPDYLVSRDGNTALVYARIKPAFDKLADPAAITAETRKLAAEFRRGDHEIHLTGSPIVTSAFQETSSHDTAVLVPLLLLMVLLFLVASFRRFGGVVMPLTVIIVSVVASLAVGGWLGLELSVVTMTLPQVMIAVCVSDAVHLLAVFYQARQRGLARRDAAYFSLSKNLHRDDPDQHHHRRRFLFVRDREAAADPGAGRDGGDGDGAGVVRDLPDPGADDGEVAGARAGGRRPTTSPASTKP